MSDRGFLFLFSILMIVGGLGSAAWLILTGQALTVDGLFLALVSLLVAVVFGMYVVYLIRRAMDAQGAAEKPVAKQAAATAAKQTATPVAQ